jgi:polysaccharide pyruvyl transferase WcaK-like protein
MITLYDTSIASKNIGDFIIMDAVRNELEPLIPQEQIITLPTHDSIGFEGLKLLRKSNFSVVGGSNLLSSNILSYKQWKFNAVDLLFLENSVLMGVGWWQYQKKADFLSALIWKRLLHNDMIHSVRDELTEKKLNEIGIKNVLNTSCATMWKLDQEHCNQIPKNKGEIVVFTLTDYNQDPIADRTLITNLIANYDKVHFWPQGTGDSAYFDTLMEEIKGHVFLLDPNLTALNTILSLENIDYIGTRLHAGIRALQLKVRTIIIGIDNRANEKSKDFNLLVIERKDINHLNDVINSSFETKIVLPMNNIIKWKSQF